MVEYRFGHKRNITSLHGEGGDEQDAFVYDVKHGIHSSTVPTIVGPKVVLTRPGLLKFLTAISKFVTRIFIWSSLKKSTVQKIVEYCFCGLPLPFDILGQNSCQKIETSQGKYLTIIGGSKEIFLKNLSKALFVGSTLLDQENTIFIDDNPEKCTCNDQGTVYSSRHGVPLILQTIFSCIRLFFGYSDCTTSIVMDSSRI